MQAVGHAADMQDRDGGVLLKGTLFGVYPFLRKLYADAGYLGPKFRDGLKAVCRTVNVEIVRRRDLHTFVVLPKRRIVDRTIAWLKRCRRLAKDWECRNRSALAFLRWASIRLMLRRLCQNARRSWMDSQANFGADHCYTNLGAVILPLSEAAV
jgi:transposase